MARPQAISRARVVQLVGEGLTDAQVAVRLNCTPSSVARLRIEALGAGTANARADKPVWTKERLAWLRQWWNVDKLSAGQIVGKFGGLFTRNAVMGQIHRSKLAPRPSPIASGGKAPRDNNGAFMQRVKSRATDAERKHGVGSNTFLFGAKSAAAQTTPQPKAQLVPAVPPKMRDRVESGTIAERPPIVPAGRAEFRALAGSRLCMWIEGQTVPGSAHLAMTCGAATEPGCPWCAQHRAPAWQGRVAQVAA